MAPQGEAHGVGGIRTWWRGSGGRRARRALGATSLVLAVLLAAPTVALRAAYAGVPGEGTRTRGHDAYWLGHAWVDGRKSEQDLDAFAAKVRGSGIKDLFVHTGPLEHNGTLSAARYPRAAWLVAGVHRRLPGVRVQAWLGDQLASEGPVGLRLEDPGTRTAVVTTARQVLDRARFDGVHFDLEPLPSGDRNYLALLDALHALTRQRGALLSVAAHQIDPLPALHSVADSLTGHGKWWSQSYFGQVARRVDQIAVMSYDTAMPVQSMYGGYVARQTALALQVTPERTDLLMGLPFYDDESMSHHGGAETVEAAVRGARLGLARTDRRRQNFGVALYVDFAERDEDWAAYRAGWS
ncbi:glycosyl hydrolase family 18 protein [Streptomyces sp. NPDC048111]|uniref:glycosyl hydrolase family 18 protein n=1 Tax=Streptomyces sp. NPDC048111 TaxID=3365500 RepID=UPI00371756EB